MKGYDYKLKIYTTKEIYNNLPVYVILENVNI